MVLVLLCRRDLRAFLLRPGVILPHLVAAALYVVWHRYLIGSAQQSMDVTAVVEKLRAFDLRRYLNQLWSFPWNLCSVSSRPAFSPGIARCAQGPAARRRQRWDPAIATGAGIALLGVLPYWLWPDTGSRYVMPLYALAAFLLAHVLWRQELSRMRLVVNCLLAVIVVKYVAALVGLSRVSARAPWRLRRSGGGGRGTDEGICALRHGRFGDRLERGGQHRRKSLSAATVAVASAEWSAGFVLANAENPEVGPVFRRYSLGGKTLYVLCRGKRAALAAIPEVDDL